MVLGVQDPGRRGRRGPAGASSPSGPGDDGTGALGRRVRKSKSTTWAAKVSEFLNWKRSESSVGEPWLGRMRWELLRFPKLLERVGVPDEVALTPASVSPDHIASLKKGLNWEKATFSLHFAALRQLLAWSHNPVAARRSVWSLPAGEPTHRRWLSKAQLIQLYRGARSRGRLLVALEGLNGLRRVEVLRLTVRDVLLDEGCLRVLGKGTNGGKWRKIPIFPQSAKLLRAAVLGRAAADHLIPLSRSGADQLLQRSVRRSGLHRAGIRVSHHDLRRTFGRLAHDSGMDLVQLKNLYGHASLEMTVHYIGLDSEAMRDGLERLGRSLGKL